MVSTEPSSLPAGLGTEFSILVPVMCRTITLVASHSHTSLAGLPATRYTAHPTSLARDPCYCPHDRYQSNNHITSRDNPLQSTKNKFVN